MKYNTDRSFRLTDGLKEQCRTQFELHPEIRQLTEKADRLMHQGHFREAMQAKQQKEALFSRVVAEYEKQVGSQVSEVKLSAVGLPQKDIDEIERIMVTLFMAIDIMDSCLIDINDIIRRKDPCLSFEKIDDLHEMANMCREQLSQFYAKQDYRKYEHWGYITDDMYDLMQNKAKAIIRKTREKQHQQ